MDPSKFKVLIVDDEADFVELVSYILEKEGYQILTASNGISALEIAQTENPDLIILDIMMPEMDGIEVCQELRGLAQFNNTRITFLTARSEDYSQIAGFEAGADDYITKPIKPRLLVARIKALLKDLRSSAEIEETINLPRITIDQQKRIVFIKGERVDLPRKEFDLLTLMASQKGRVFNRKHIYESIWNADYPGTARTIDVHIRKLRKKLGEDCIQTVKGVGYKFNV